MMAVFEALCSFNSTLVQLKENAPNTVTLPLSSFNSTLVQLKVTKVPITCL